MNPSTPHVDWFLYLVGTPASIYRLVEAKFILIQERNTKVPNLCYNSTIKFQACKNPYKNRYCNLFPFDTNLVVLDNEGRYVNASWIDLPGIYSIKILNFIQIKVILIH